MGKWEKRRRERERGGEGVIHEDDQATRRSTRRDARPISTLLAQDLADERFVVDVSVPGCVKRMREVEWRVGQLASRISDINRQEGRDSEREASAAARKAQDLFIAPSNGAAERRGAHPQTKTGARLSTTGPSQRIDPLTSALTRANNRLLRFAQIAHLRSCATSSRACLHAQQLFRCRLAQGLFV